LCHFNVVKLENDDTNDVKNDKELRSLKALSDETRVRILLLLENEEACVCELMHLFKMTQPRISHHLIMLRDAGFLLSERRGKWNFYTLAHRTSEGMNMRLLEVIRTSFQDKSVVQNDRQTFREVTRRFRKSC
jgi:ArsR family transcriptional regulator